MPQLDRAIILTQVFWLIIILIGSYILIIFQILPRLFKSLKVRVQLINKNLNNIEQFKKEQVSSINKFQFILCKSLVQARKLSLNQLNFFKYELFNTINHSNEQLNLDKTLVKFVNFIPVYKTSVIKGLPSFSFIGYLTRPKQLN